MKYELIDEAEAPPNLDGMSPGARAKVALLRALTPDKVARIDPEGGSLRALKASITRLAGNLGLVVEVWSDEGHAYVRLRN